MRNRPQVRYAKAAASLAIASAILIFAGLTGGFSPASAVATAPPLGNAETYSVLGGASVTNTGNSDLSGDLGVSPGTSITGFPPGEYGGTLHQTDAHAAQAQQDLTTAYDNAAGQAPDVVLASPELGGRTLTPGVYKNPTNVDSMQLTGTLTLDAQGNPDAVWIFQIKSTLTTASNSSVSLINGADPCNVFWQVGSSATLGSDTDFVGTIMALASISTVTGTDVIGRLLARTGSVTLQNTDVTTTSCADGGVGDDGPGDDGPGDDGPGDDGADDGPGDDGADDGPGDDGADDGPGDDGADDGPGDDGADDGPGDDGADDGPGDDGGDDGPGDDGGDDGPGDDGGDDEGDDGGDDDGDDNGDGSDSSKEGDSVPKGNPRTGMGGTASDTDPTSVLLLTMGGLAGSGAVLCAAAGLRPTTRGRH